MTTAQNNVDALDRNQSRTRLPVTTNLTVNNGDLVWWDTGQSSVTPVTLASQLNGINFLGISLQANANLIYPNDADQWGVLVLFRGVVWLNTTSGDTYNWFDPVTVGADAQTITKAGVTTNNTIGYVFPIPTGEPSSPRASQATPTPESVAGGTGVRIQVALAPTHKYAAAV